MLADGLTADGCCDIIEVTKPRELVRIEIVEMIEVTNPREDVLLVGTADIDAVMAVGSSPPPKLIPRPNIIIFDCSEQQADPSPSSQQNWPRAGSPH